MSYTDSLLASGERIVLRSRQHWFVMVWNSRWAVVAILLAVALIVMRALIGGGGTVLDLLGWLTAILFLIGLVVIAWGWIRYQNEEFVITSRRIIHVSGVVNKKASDSSLEMINDAVLTESVFGRMFGFGDLEVLTASESGIDDLLMLTNAKAFKKAMIEAKHELALELERPTMPPIRGTSGTDAAADATSSAAPSPGTAPAAPAPMPPSPSPYTLTGDVSPRAGGQGGSGIAAPGTPTAAPAPAAPAAGSSGAPPAAHDGASSLDTAEALERLGELRDRGIVTEEEFEQKKRELLDRL
jgi:Bacterial PH domain/Short C-terminal domain